MLAYLFHSIARQLSARDHLQDLFQAVGRVRSNRVRDGYAHHLGDVLLTDVPHEEKLNGFPLPTAEVNTGLVEVFQIMQGIQHSVRRRDGVHALRFEEGPERLKVLQK